MKFKSNTKYNEEPKTGSVFALKDNSLEIVIHKYVGCGDALFLKAKEVVIRKVKKIREDSYRFYSDNNIEFDRY